MEQNDLTKDEIRINRVEPPGWWIGMKNSLQLMIRAEDIRGAEVSVSPDGIRIVEVHQADSPNYLFVDLEIPARTAPGTYTFTLTKDGRSGSFRYRIENRKEGSAERKSFTPADTVYLLMPDRFARGKSADASDGDTIESINRSDPFGRHGGNLRGIVDHLDYLDRLGVTALWLSPVQLDNQATASYHGYSCADLYRIDPRFGTNDSYRELVEQAHRKGLKIIMDVVLNHCGTAHWWMEDLPFKTWIHTREKDITSTYRLVSINDPNVAPDDLRRTIDGWFDTDMPDIGLENPFTLRYFTQAYIWWMEWAGLDGLRVDTFPYNDKYAASRWVRSILDEYPNLNIVAECWHSSPAIVSYWDGGKMNPDGYCSYLPCIMDFPLQEAIDKALADNRDAWDAGMNLLYEAVAHDFLFSDPGGMLIFLDNHDMDRFADTVGGDPDKIKIGLTLLATLRGIPQLYYGTEFGMRSADLSSGDGGNRADFPGGWEGDEKDFFHKKGMSAVQQEVFEHARTLFTWRREARVIHKGKTMHFMPEENT